jgi:hypothetical protein
MGNCICEALYSLFTYKASNTYCWKPTTHETSVGFQVTHCVIYCFLQTYYFFFVTWYFHDIFNMHCYFTQQLEYLNRMENSNKDITLKLMNIQYQFVSSPTSLRTINASWRWRGDTSFGQWVKAMRLHFTPFSTSSREGPYEQWYTDL